MLRLMICIFQDMDCTKRHTIFISVAESVCISMKFINTKVGQLR